MENIIQIIPAVGWQVEIRKSYVPLVCFALVDDGEKERMVGMVANGLGIQTADSLPGFEGYVFPNEKCVRPEILPPPVGRPRPALDMLMRERKNIKNAGNKDPLLARGLRIASVCIHHTCGDEYATVEQFLATLQNPDTAKRFRGCRGMGPQVLEALQKYFANYTEETN